MDPNANNYMNDQNIELAWAIKASEYADVHLNLLAALGNPHYLKLNPNDEKIYEQFRKDFPDMKVSFIDVDHLKSIKEKEQWRKFSEKFHHIEDFNFGTLLRVDSSKDYSQENTTIVPRIQFLAIESARNREDLNIGLKVPDTNEESVQS